MSTPRRLAPRAYAAGAERLAQRLLGCILVRILSDGSRLSGVIVETEAYLGVIDRASHAFNGRRTPRNESMYARAGTSYVYFTYGMHHCMNVVCRRAGVPEAVLIRALEPLDGIERQHTHRSHASRRRGRRPFETRDLCSGPGKLTQSLAIDLSLDRQFMPESDALWIELGRTPRDIERGPRIGIDSAGAWANEPLRFWIRGHPCVSR